MYIRKPYVGMIGFVFGLIASIIFYESYKIIGFFVAIICFNLMITPTGIDEITKKKELKFSPVFLLLSLVVYLLLPTSLFTFDANNPVDIVDYLEGATAFIDVIAIIIFIGFPLFMIAGVAWSFYKGNVDKATSGLTKVIFVIGALIASLGVLNSMDLQFFGVINWASDFYIILLETIIKLPVYAYDGLTDIFANLGWEVVFPELPSEYSKLDLKGLTFDSLSTENSVWVYTVNDSLPFLAAFACLFLAIITATKDWERGFDKILVKIGEMDVPEKEKGLIIGRKKKEGTKNIFNPFLLVFVLVIMVLGFFVFINYSSQYGKDPQQDFLYIGYFSFYTSSSFAILILYNTQENLYYKRGTVSDNAKGIIIGLALVFLTTRLFYSVQLMTVYSFGGIEQAPTYIINQGIYVAPAETLIFHNFFLSVVIALIVYFTKKTKTTLALEKGNDMLLYFDNQILKSEIKSDIYKVNGQQKEYAKEMLKIENYKRKRNETESKIVSNVRITEYEIFGTYKILFFIIGAFVSNILFSSLHFFNSATDDYFFFWVCGLGLIYFCGGMLFTYISFKYSWFAGVICHFFYNISTIMMFLAFTGA